MNQENSKKTLLKINKQLEEEIRKHEETTRQLEEKQQFLDNILNNAPLVIWSIDLEGKFTYTQFKDGPGNPVDRLGKSAFDLYKGTEAELFIRRVLAGETDHEIVMLNGLYYETRVSPIFDKTGVKTGYLGVSFDITERIKSEREQKKFRQILDQAPGGVFIMDKDFNFEYLNPYFEKLSGFPIHELLHKNISDTLYKNLTETPESRKDVINSLTNGKNWQGELRTIGKDGNIYWANTLASPFKNEKGEIDGYFVIQQDITEKKQTELTLAEQEKLYRTLIEKSLDGIVISQDGKVVLVNKAFADMIGYSIEECIENFGPQSIAPEDRERVMDIHYRRMKGEIGDMRYNASMLRKNGEKMVAEFNSTTIEMNGKPASLISIRDVTERFRMQETIEKSERKYKTLVENSLEGITIIRDNRILFANDTYCKMLGYTREELYNMPSVNTLHPDDHEKAYKIAERRRKKDFSTINEVFRMLTKTGEIRECETSSTLIEFEGTWASFFTSHDITEKRKMELKLLESEEKYRLLFEAESDAIFMIDADSGQIIDTNPAASKIYGYSHGEFLQMKNTDVSAEPHKTTEATLRRDTKVLLRYHRKKDGTVFPVELSAGFTIFKGKKIQIVTSRDITENKKMQDALSESEQKYRELAEMLPQTVYEHDLNGKLTYLNQAGKKTFRIESIESGISVHDLVVPEDLERMINNMKKSYFENSTSRGNSYTAIRMNGEKFPVMIFATPMFTEGKITGTRGIVIDMTEYVAMEKALRESELKYRELTEMLPQTVYELDTLGNIIYFNQTGMKQFGLDDSDVGLSSYRFIHPSFHEQMRENMKNTITHKVNSYGNRYIAVRKNGETFPAMTFAAPIIAEDKVIGIRGLILDISEHEAMEKALRDSELKYRTLIDKATDGILITQDGVFRFVNPAFCEMMQYTEEELLEKPFIDVVDKAHHNEMLENHKRRMTGESFPSIFRAKLYRKDGQSIMVELNSRTTDFNGKPASFVITRDITDRLQTEEELLKAKAELEMLNQNLENRVHESTLKLTEANTQLIRLQKENLQSQFEVLRQQVNPHFLFNSLNVLTSLIKLEPDLAEQFTEHLSKVYRYVLENKDNDFVSLQTELDFLDAYIFLLNIRFMDKIIVKVDISEQKRECQILPLALQLLIENAIKHNSMSKRNPLKIEIFIGPDNVLHVENNLQERESHMVSTGVGLRNIAHRYNLLEMPEPEFIKTETKFIARVPLKC